MDGWMMEGWMLRGQSWGSWLSDRAVFIRRAFDLEPNRWSSHWRRPLWFSVVKLREVKWWFLFWFLHHQLMWEMAEACLKMSELLPRPFVAPLPVTTIRRSTCTISCGGLQVLIDQREHRRDHLWGSPSHPGDDLIPDRLDDICPKSRKIPASNAEEPSLNLFCCSDCDYIRTARITGPAASVLPFHQWLLVVALIPHYCFWKRRNRQDLWSHCRQTAEAPGLFTQRHKCNKAGNANTTCTDQYQPRIRPNQSCTLRRSVSG